MAACFRCFPLVLLPGEEQRTCVYGSEPCCYPDLLLLRALLMNTIWQENILWENTSPPFSTTVDICSIPRWRSSFSSCRAISKTAEEYVLCWALRGSTRGREEEDGRCSPLTAPVLCAAGPREPTGRAEGRARGCGCCDSASTCCSQGKNKYCKNKNLRHGSPNTLRNSETCCCEENDTTGLESWPFEVCSLIYSWVSSVLRRCSLAFLKAGPGLWRSRCRGAFVARIQRVPSAADTSAVPPPLASHTQQQLGSSTWVSLVGWGLFLGGRWYWVLAGENEPWFHTFCSHRLRLFCFPALAAQVYANFCRRKTVTYDLVLIQLHMMWWVFLIKQCSVLLASAAFICNYVFFRATAC